MIYNLRSKNLLLEYPQGLETPKELVCIDPIIIECDNINCDINHKLNRIEVQILLMEKLEVNKELYYNHHSLFLEILSELMQLDKKICEILKVIDREKYCTTKSKICILLYSLLRTDLGKMFIEVNKDLKELSLDYINFKLNKA